MNKVRHVLVIYNPTAGWRRRRRVDDFCAALRAAGCAVTLRATAASGDATAIAGEARNDHIDVIAVAGGDGTVNEVINGLNGAAPPIAIVPIGTANVAALELGLPMDMAGAAAVAAGGIPTPVRVGLINGRRFLQMAGVGFDARVVKEVTPSLKRRLGKAAYVLRTLIGFVRYRLPPYDVTLDGAERRVASAVIAKGHFYGGTFTCAPDARLADPWFHVCLFRGGGGWNALRYAAGLVTGRLPKFSDVEIVRAREVRIAGNAGEPVQADGEIVATLPATATIAPEPIVVLTPAG